MNLKQINWGLIITIIFCILFWIAVAVGCSGCQRTDYHWQDDLLSISSTSWCADTNIKKIMIDPNGLVIIEQFDRKADSLKVKANPLIHQYEAETSE